MTKLGDGDDTAPARSNTSSRRDAGSIAMAEH
jgi:hypothetical protein